MAPSRHAASSAQAPGCGHYQAAADLGIFVAVSQEEKSAMFDANYYKSLSMEIEGLKNRVRSLVRHWPTDGEWKESVLRTILHRHVPRTAEIGRGFIVSPAGQSTQIDVLICDSSKPILFRDGDLYIVTPDAVLGAIEVKTSVTRSSLDEAARKLAANAELVRDISPGNERIFGLFSYEDETGEDVVSGARAPFFQPISGDGTLSW
jgi:hypothetical protein